MKNKMFKIVGVFSFFIAAMALIVAVVMSMTGTSFMFSGSNEVVNLSAKSSISDYLESKKEAEQLRIYGNTKGEDFYEEDPDQENQEYFSKIIKSINEFAAITGQSTANKDGITAYLNNEINQLSNDESVALLKSLDSDLSELNHKAKSIAAIDKDNIDYVDWIKFTEWNVNTFKESLDNEKERVIFEARKAESKKAEGTKLLMFSGGVFAIFVLFVLIMLLVQIESNTRKKEV